MRRFREASLWQTFQLFTYFLCWAFKGGELVVHFRRLPTGDQVTSGVVWSVEVRTERVWAKAECSVTNADFWIQTNPSILYASFQSTKVFLFRTQMTRRTLQLDISTTDIIKEIDDFSSNIVARKTKRIRGVAEVAMRKPKRCNRLGWANLTTNWHQRHRKLFSLAFCAEDNLCQWV